MKIIIIAIVCSLLSWSGDRVFVELCLDCEVNGTITTITVHSSFSWEC